MSGTADAPLAPPLDVWVVTDGRAGIEAQALGLAEAVAELAAARITVKRVRWRPWLRRMPTRLIAAPRLALDAGSDPLQPPWPDLWIGNGRAAVPAGIAVRRWSGGRTFVVQLQDPLRPPRLFDLVIPPAHDRLSGDHVLPILGAPHRMSARRLADARDAFAARLEPLPAPRVALLVGGRSRAFDLPPERARELGAQVRTAVTAAGGSVMATFSRRTPPEAEAALREALAGAPGWVWDGEGPNPLAGFLAWADHVIVTADSINMVTEAAATGAPVHIAAVEGRQARKDRFHAALAEAGVARPFTGALDAWSPAPLRETERAAAAVLRRMAARAGGASP